MTTDELIEELEAFDPLYKTRYKSLRDAAKAAGIAREFEVWVKSPDGQRWLEVSKAHDHVADNHARRAQLEAELNMASRGRVAQARGHLTEEDQV